MADGSSRRSKRRSQMFVMLAAGVAAGVALPLISRALVTPKTTGAWAVFWCLSLSAGLALGALCHVVSSRTSRSILRAILQDASRTLGVTAEDGHGVEEMTAEINKVLQRVSDLHSQSRQVAQHIRGLSADVLNATEEQASGAAEQAAAVTETSATLEELAQTSKQIAENSEAVVCIAERTLASAEEGMAAVHDTASGIEEIRHTTQASSDRILALGERSTEIGRVLVIIDEIAEQTKILALNAAIEAARAGEAGKGFAVVAEEIRKLADSVTESTQEIGRVVREMQASASALVMSTEKAAKKVDEGRELAHKTAESLERIVSQVEETTDAAKQISVATQQQRSASDQVVVSMREVAHVSQHAAETSRQISAAIVELNNLTASLSAK